jgi:hypothetical protein
MADLDGLSFYQKKRVAPWLPEREQPQGYKKWSQYGIPAMVWHTHKPPNPKQTWLVAGEWDAMLLGWQMKHQAEIAIATFTAGEGNLPKDDQERNKLQGEIITFYDLDTAGQKGAEKVQAVFKDSCRIAIVPAPSNAKDGWDVSVHTDVYHHWISQDVHQRAFDALLSRSDRPRPPS